MSERRARRRPGPGVDPATGLPKYCGTFRCACGKVSFLTRKAARAALKRTFPGESMQVYRCNRGGVEVWHYGHPWGHERTA